MTEFDKYDTDCKQMYGNRTCILYQLKDDLFKIKFLDKKISSEVIDRKTFYKIIPEMITTNYTIVIVESNEITTVHHPTQTNLITPPLIQ